MNISEAPVRAGRVLTEIASKCDESAVSYTRLLLRLRRFLKMPLVRLPCCILVQPSLFFDGSSPGVVVE